MEPSCLQLLLFGLGDREESAEERQRDRVMRKEKLLQALRSEVNQWSSQTSGQLRSQLEETLSYSSKLDDEAYQVQIEVLEDTDTYVHVLVAVDDGSLWRGMNPLSTSFLVHDDGRVDRPDM